tara:strand:+ start:2010 stop:3176 length:1167 start_codon:yes stop_codon:yes gene_type:complete
MLKNKKHIAVLGSTGSIGTQTLEIIKTHQTFFEVFVLSCNSNYKLLYKQALYFKPKYVVINSSKGYVFLKNHLKKTDTRVVLGLSDLSDLMGDGELDLVVAAIVGSAGLLPTIAAIKAGKTIALANKETLVVAGELIMNLVKKHNASILPVDSEHSAIFQCLVGEDPNTINKLIITASGGPFLNRDVSDFKNITIKDALKHPNWDMGAKITIDSATLMNKGFELIEARWLFNLSGKNIDVLVHPQSIVHSLVEFVDGSVKAQLGLPNMTIPILYALFYPKRQTHPIKNFNLSKITELTFFDPNKSKFPHLQLAYDCLQKGGTAACSLNAANEIVVDAFLNKKIGFLNMIKIIENSLEKSIFVSNPNLDDYLQVDLETRKITTELIYKK